MSSVHTVEPLELDLTIDVRRLPAPSERVEGSGTSAEVLSPENRRRYPLTIQANCGTDVWDCTAAWVCG